MIQTASAEIFDDNVWINIHHDSESKVLIRDLNYSELDNTLEFSKVVIYKNQEVHSLTEIKCKDNSVKETNIWVFNSLDRSVKDKYSEYYSLSTAPIASHIKETYCGLTTSNSNKKFLFSFPIMK